MLTVIREPVRTLLYSAHTLEPRPQQDRRTTDIRQNTSMQHPSAHITIQNDGRTFLLPAAEPADRVPRDTVPARNHFVQAARAQREVSPALHDREEVLRRLPAGRGMVRDAAVEPAHGALHRLGDARARGEARYCESVEKAHDIAGEGCRRERADLRRRAA